MLHIDMRNHRHSSTLGGYGPVYSNVKRLPSFWSKFCWVFFEVCSVCGSFFTNRALDFLSELVSLKIHAHKRIQIEKFTGCTVLLGNPLNLIQSHCLLMVIIVIILIFNLWVVPFLSKIPLIGKDVFCLRYCILVCC